MTSIYRISCVTIILLVSLNISAAAQSGNSSEPIGVGEASGVQKQTKGKVLQDLTLGTIQIKYKIQTPRIKFAMERIPIQLSVDNEKLENLNGLINKQPPRLIYLNKRLERPRDIQSSRMIRHTMGGK